MLAARYQMNLFMDTGPYGFQHATKIACILQEHYVLLLGAAIFFELAGGVLFVLNISVGAYFLVRSRLCLLATSACFCWLLLPRHMAQYS
jgi:hypothetical protein